MKLKRPTRGVTWAVRSGLVMGGLAMAACVPVRVPPGQGATATEDESATPVATFTDVSTETLTPEGTITLTPEGTLTATETATDNATVEPTLTPSATITSTETVTVTETLTPTETMTATLTSTPVTPSATVTGTVTNPAPSSTPNPSETIVPGQRVEFIGTIESFQDGYLIVSGRKVVVTADTRIKFQPHKGLNVKVEGVLQSDGSILASEIKSVPDGLATHWPHQTWTPMPDYTWTPQPTQGSTQQPTQQGTETEFTGTVSSINGDVYVVDGVTVIVVGKVKDAINVGDVVKVEGTLQSDGTVLAHEIKLASRDDDHDGHGDHDGNGHGHDDDDEGNGHGNGNGNGNGNGHGNGGGHGGHHP